MIRAAFSAAMPYIMGALLAAALALAGWIMLLKDDLVTAKAENARLTRSIAALQEQAAQSRLAREVEAARAAKWQARSSDLQTAIETIINGDFSDAPLPPDLADLVNGLRSGD